MAVEAIKGAAGTFREVPKMPIKSEARTADAPVLEPRQVVHTATSAKGQEQQEEDKQNTNQKRLQNAVNNVNSKIKHAKTKAEFSYHEATKRVSIKLIDEETDEIIKEIPPQETLEMIEKMWELAGIMVDEKR